MTSDILERSRRMLAEARGEIQPDLKPDPVTDTEPAPTVTVLPAAEDAVGATVGKKSLIDAAVKLCRIIGRRSVLPVLSTVKVTVEDGQVTLTGTDLEITAVIPVETYAVSGDGEWLIPGIMLRDTAKTDAGNDGGESIELGYKPGQVRVGATTLSDLIAIDDWPRLQVLEGAGERFDQHDSDALAAALKTVIPAASKDDARPILTGVYFDTEDGHLRVLSTDSYRLHLADTSIVWPARYGNPLVPARGMAEIPRITGTVRNINVKSPYVKFTGDAGVLTVRVIEGTFPNYRELLPGGSGPLSDEKAMTVEVDTGSLLRALKALKPICGDSVPVRLSFDGAHLFAEAEKQDLGSNSIQVDGTWTGHAHEVLEKGKIAFNLPYLRAAVLAGRTEAKAMKGDPTTIELWGSLKPGVIRNEIDGWFGLLMPVRL